MAAYYFDSKTGTDIFKIIPIVSNVTLGFIDTFFSGEEGRNETMLIISEVLFQNRDTIQYFLTFDDLITYFYFGKGLGTMTITGSIIADCDGGWNLYNELMAHLGTLRGKKIGEDDTLGPLIVGGVTFTGILNSFTVRAGTDPNSLHTVDFTLQLDIIDSSFARPTINSTC